MNEPAKATFYGYISTTQDALLIFECVRRGLLPKLNRRLREEERGLIRSGHIFVFDERESGIKRWTDGLLWSPSRILLNFLVYRQIEKKPGKGGDKASSSSQAHNSAASNASSSVDPLAMGVGPSKRASTSSSSSHRHCHALEGSSGSGSGSNEAPGTAKGKAHLRSLSSGSSSSLAAAGVVEMGSKPDNKADEPASAWAASSASVAAAAAAKKHSDMEERSIVGSLTNSYPFAKDGLCKKTISIQVEGSTQHLISYYSVDDVRSGRLRTPSSLPEIAALAISPMFLNKATFRFPPAIVVGPDGIPRYSGEGTETNNSPRKTDPGGSSSGEGSGGSVGHDPRYVRAAPTASPMTFSPSDPFPPAAGQAPYDAMSPEALPGSAFAPPFYPSAPSGAVSGATDRFGLRVEDTRPAPLPHQIGGSGIAPLARRASDSPLRARSGSGRFEPYAYTPTPALGEGSGVISPRMGSSGRANSGVIHGWPVAQSATMVSQHSQGSTGPARRLQSSRSLWNLNEAGQQQQQQQQQQEPGQQQDTSSNLQAANLAAASTSSSPAPVILRPSSSQQQARPFANIDWRGVRSPCPPDDGGVGPSSFPTPSADAGWQSSYPSRPSSSLAQPYEAGAQMHPPQQPPTQSQQPWTSFAASSAAPTDGFTGSPYVAAATQGAPEDGSAWGARASISSMASSIHEELGLGEAAQGMYDAYAASTGAQTHPHPSPSQAPPPFQPFGDTTGVGMYSDGGAAQQLLGSLGGFAPQGGGQGGSSAPGDQGMYSGSVAQPPPQEQQQQQQQQQQAYSLSYDSQLPHQQQRSYDGHQ